MFRPALWLLGAALVCLSGSAAILDEDSIAPSNGLLPRFNTRSNTGLPPRDTRICGRNGYLDNFSGNLAGGNSTVPNVAACRVLCSGRTDYGICKGFSYAASTSFCVLYSDPLPEQNFRADPTSPYKFYSIYCQPLPIHCPAPPYTSIVDNGGFEFSNFFIGPWEAVGRSYGVIRPGHNSPYAFRGNGSTKLLQIHDICNSANYSFSVDIMVTRPPTDRSGFITNLLLQVGQAELTIEYFPSYIPGGAGAAYGSWRTFQGTTRGPYYTYKGMLATRFGVDYGNAVTPSNYQIYIDNFVVKTTTTATYQTIGQDLIRNGGFESGYITPWIIKTNDNAYRPFTSKVVAQGLTPDSQYSYKYYGVEYEEQYYSEYCDPQGHCTYTPNPDGGQDMGGVSLSQHITLIPGKLYQLSFAYVAKNINKFEVSITARHPSTITSSIVWTLLGSTSPYDFNYNNDIPVSDNLLRNFSRVFEALVPKATLSLALTGLGVLDPENDIVTIDNVSIKQLAVGQSL